MLATRQVRGLVLLRNSLFVSVAVVFRVHAARVNLETIRQSYDNYCGLRDGHDKARNNRAEKSLDHDALPGNELLWTKACDADRVAEETL